MTTDDVLALLLDLEGTGAQVTMMVRDAGDDTAVPMLGGRRMSVAEAIDVVALGDLIDDAYGVEPRYTVVQYDAPGN